MTGASQSQMERSAQMEEIMAETASDSKTTRGRRSTTSQKKTDSSKQSASTAKQSDKTSSARSVLPKVEGHQWTLSRSMLGGYTLELHETGKGTGTGFIVTVSRMESNAHDAIEKAGQECIQALEFQREMNEKLGQVKGVESLQV